MKQEVIYKICQFFFIEESGDKRIKEGWQKRRRRRGGGGERQREAAGGDVNAGFLCYILATNCELSQPGPEQGWIYVRTLVPCLIALSA